MVIDVDFPAGALPTIRHALLVEREGLSPLVIEVLVANVAVPPQPPAAQAWVALTGTLVAR